MSSHHSQEILSNDSTHCRKDDIGFNRSTRRGRHNSQPGLNRASRFEELPTSRPVTRASAYRLSQIFAEAKSATKVATTATNVSRDESSGNKGSQQIEEVRTIIQPTMSTRVLDEILTDPSQADLPDPNQRETS
jgi:hypothetical protein